MIRWLVYININKTWIWNELDLYDNFYFFRTNDFIVIIYVNYFMKFKTLDLFSGLGGFSLGLERTGHFKTVAFCDNDKYSKLIIDKHWKGTKIYNDVREINKEQFKKDGIEFPEIITGGFPCQPFSVAGKKQGTNDDRHLWPEMFRIIQEFTPRWIIGENVKNITNIQDGMVFETVCTDLEREGYEVRAFNIPAAGVGAPHRRERIWIVAHRKESMVNTDNVRLEQHNETKKEPSWWRTSTTFEPTSDVAHSKSIESDVGRGRQHQEERERQMQIRGKNSDDANTNGERLQGHRSEYELRNSEEEEQTSGNSWWSVEPNVGRVANGVSGRIYRLKGLGNSIVPKIAEEIGKAIVEAENEME